jgi:dipeptidyl aminopeptidase/acylaminoacyl peptidase
MTTDLPLIPREVLLGNPTRVAPSISPDGQRLAYIAPHDGVLNIWVVTVGAGAAFDDKSSEVVSSDRDRGIREFFWSPAGDRILYLQDKGGDENWRLYDVDLTTREVRDLTPFDNVQAQVLLVDFNHPEAIVIGLNRDNEQLHDPFRLDLKTGELEKLAENPGFIAWGITHDFVPRAGFAPTPDGGIALMLRSEEGGEWQPAEMFDASDAMSMEPVGFSGDDKALFITHSKDANAARLVRFDIATRDTTVLAEDPHYDVAAVNRDPDTKEPRFVAFARDRLDWQALQPDLQADLDAVRALHPGDFGFVGRDKADTTWLIGFTADDGPVQYYVYDRATKQGTFLFDHRPELRDYTLARTEPFSFTARDGLEVHGYLTFPPGFERSSLPTVLNVHGGPWARDMWGLDPEDQLLANRGYLAVNVNYRGSTGYGKDFLNAGDREWGGKMHLDLIDAVEWLVAQGYSDRDKIAIYGGSYGGYAALVGATFTPDVFCCAVDIVGVCNLKTFIESIPPYWAPMLVMLKQRVGDPETEADFLWSRSPLSRVGDIRIPMLIAQGANDPRVKQAESEQIVAAMKENGIPHEYLLFPDEGHGFAKPENRLRFYTAAERFLAEHLGGRFEP